MASFFGHSTDVAAMQTRLCCRRCMLQLVAALCLLAGALLVVLRCCVLACCKNATGLEDRAWREACATWLMLRRLARYHIALITCNVYRCGSYLYLKGLLLPSATPSDTTRTTRPSDVEKGNGTDWSPVRIMCLNSPWCFFDLTEKRQHVHPTTVSRTEQYGRF